MTTRLQAIRSILQPELIEERNIELVEEFPDGRRQVVRLNKSGPALRLKLDRPPRAGISANDWLFPLFDPTRRSLTCMCDYIVFCNSPKRDDSRLFAFLCELKSSNPGGAIKQIRNGRLMSDFIIAMARHHEQVTHNWDVAYRGLVFSTIAKPFEVTTRSGAPPYQPDTVMKDLKRADFACKGSLQLELLCA
jgi:hypothetical protein